jgi:hypothetical protein
VLHQYVFEYFRRPWKIEAPSPLDHDTQRALSCVAPAENRIEADPPDFLAAQLADEFATFNAIGVAVHSLWHFRGVAHRFAELLISRTNGQGILVHCFSSQAPHTVDLKPKSSVKSTRKKPPFLPPYSRYPNQSFAYLK